MTLSNKGNSILILTVWLLILFTAACTQPQPTPVTEQNQTPLTTELEKTVNAEVSAKPPDVAAIIIDGDPSEWQDHHIGQQP